MAEKKFEEMSLFEAMQHIPSKLEGGLNAMFGKKKKEEAKNKAPDEDVKVTTEEAELDTKAKKVQKQLTELEKQLLGKIQNYNQHYAGVFSPEAVANYSFAELESQKLSLTFGVFSELVEIRKLLEAIKADSEGQ